MSCGCNVPEASHGDPRNIVLQDVVGAAEASGIPVIDAASNITATVNAWSTPLWRGNGEAPHISIDIDGTLTLALESLCVAVNSACGTQYTYFDMHGFNKDDNFSDNKRAQEWAKTLLSLPYGDRDATFGFYKAMAPDFAAIAAVRALYRSGVYVHVSTHRDLPLFDVCQWWLDKWGVPYHELHVGDHSKADLSERYSAEGRRISFVDDSLDLPDQLSKHIDVAYIYLLRRPNTDIPDIGATYEVVDTWRPILSDYGVTVSPLDDVPQLNAPIKKSKSVDASGICVLAKNTGRILMLQRSLRDKKGDDNHAAGRWEFPGGKQEKSDADLWSCALREWQEETGNTLPKGTIADTYEADNGYQIFIYVISKESSIDLAPNGDKQEIMAWWRIKDAKKAEAAMRNELDDFDWKMVKNVRDNKISKAFSWLKSFGDAGNTQTRNSDGTFGAGDGSSDTGSNRTLFAKALASGGFTHSIHGLPDPTEGFAVGGYAPSLVISDKTSNTAATSQINAWIKANSATIQEAGHIGGWHNKDDGNIYFDATKIHPASDREVAIADGIARNQISIYDIGADKEIPTGGTGIDKSFAWLNTWRTSTFTYLKSWGDPGNTQARNADGTFGPGNADPSKPGDYVTVSQTPVTERNEDGNSGHFVPTATETELANAKAALEAHGMTHDILMQKIGEMVAKGEVKIEDMRALGLEITPEQAAAWYQSEHDAAMAWVDHGYSPLAAAGMLAATTANVKWSYTLQEDSQFYKAGTTLFPNLSAAATVAAAVADNPALTVTQEAAAKIDAASIGFNPDKNSVTGHSPAGVDTQGGLPMSDGQGAMPFNVDNNGNPILDENGKQIEIHPSDLSDQQIGKFVSMSGGGLVTGANIGYPDSLARGVMIARGADPTVILAGYKEQSFLANVAYPEENQTTTWDSHMAQGVLGGFFGQEPILDRQGNPKLKDDGTPATQDSAVRFVGNHGGYVLLNNALLEWGQAHGMSGNQAQALAWVSTMTVKQKEAFK